MSIIRIVQFAILFNLHPFFVGSLEWNQFCPSFSCSNNFTSLLNSSITIYPLYNTHAIYPWHTLSPYLPFYMIISPPPSLPNSSFSLLPTPHPIIPSLLTSPPSPILSPCWWIRLWVSYWSLCVVY